MVSQSKSKRFKVGDKVWVQLPVGRTPGTIVEDRGPLGQGGRHIYRLEIPADPYTPTDYWATETDIERLKQQELNALAAPLPPELTVPFLKEGGLVSLLLQDGHKPVWLRLSPYGNITFTLIEGYSGTGGAVPPTQALHGERIRKDKVVDVARFLRTFGLTEEQANDVIRAVGTA